MSCRQPSANIEATAAVATATRRAVCFTCVLMIHLHHGDRRELLKERTGFAERKHRIDRLKTKEELVCRRTISKVRRVEERMIELWQTVKRQHPEARRKSGKQDRPFVGWNDERRPREQRPAGNI